MNTKEVIKVGVEQNDDIIAERDRFKIANPDVVRSFEDFRKSFAQYQKMREQFEGKQNIVPAQVGARLRG